MIGDDNQKAQAIIVAGFLIAIGIVALVVLLNSAVLSVSEQPDTTEGDVDAVTNYRSTIVTESREALLDVNDIAADKGLNNSEVNQTYVNYVNQINSRMQEVYAGEGLVGISEIGVNSSFNNAWRVRKNRTIPPTSQTRVPVDVVFVQDTSGSMSYPPGGSGTDGNCEPYDNDKCYLAKQAARGFVGSMKPLDRAAVVSFGADAGYEQRGLYKGLTQVNDNSSKEEINDTIDQLTADASTYLGGGIREAVDELQKNSNRSREKYVIALTDGSNTEGWLHFQDKYVYEEYDGTWLHEWGYSDDDVDDRLCIADTRGGVCNDPDDEDLNERDISQAGRADAINATVYTIGFGEGSLDEDHLKDIANVTGTEDNYYPAEDAGELESAFEQIYNDISRTQPVASRVNTSYRVGVNVSEFPGTGNVTLQAANNTSTVWRMRITNLSSSHPSPNNVVVDTGDGTSVLQNYDYTTLGGPPVDINVMQNSINGYGRNLSSNLLKGADDRYNITLDYSASVANVTYDIRVDDGSNVTNRLCPDPPCADQGRQTVGSVHDANFTITYRSENANYSEPIEFEVNPVQQAVQTGSSPAPTTSPTKTLNYSTPVYNYEEYYPFDKHYGDTWLEQHAFDASGNNQTMGLNPYSPTTDNFSVDVEGVESDNRGNSDDHAYYFSGNDYVRDLDGWNNIPINGSWTISMWFNPDGNVGDQVLFDASEENPAGDKVFQIATRDGGGGALFGDDELVWSYEDTNSNQVTVKSEFDTAFVDPISGSDGWHHVAVVGSWNNNRTQMFIDGQAASGSTVNMSGKPMQSTINDDGDRLGSIYVGNSLENANGRPETDGFDGRIDDVRLYHEDLSDASISTTTSETVFLEENFESGAGSWTFSDGTGINEDTSNSGSHAAYTQGGSYYGIIRSPQVDLSGRSQATIEYWLNNAGSFAGASPTPEGDDDLYLQYRSDSVGWTTLELLNPDATTVPQMRSVSVPSDGLDSGFQIRYANPNAESDGYDYWYIDDVRVISETESLSGISGTPGFIDDIFNDTMEGYVTTGWKNFTDSSGTIPEDINVDGLSLKGVDAELNGGSVSIWVQSDLDDDGTPDETSTKIEYDGSSTYSVDGLSTNNQRFRLKVAVNHTDSTDHPKFYDAQLEGS